MTSKSIQSIFGSRLEAYEFGYIYRPNYADWLIVKYMPDDSANRIKEFLELLRRKDTHFYIYCEDPDEEILDPALAAGDVIQLGEDVYRVLPSLETEKLNIGFFLQCDSWAYWMTRDNSLEDRYKNFELPSEEELFRLVKSGEIDIGVCVYGDGAEMRIISPK